MKSSLSLAEILLSFLIIVVFLAVLHVLASDKFKIRHKGSHAVELLTGKMPS